jgi:hypothetical protein
MTVYVLGVDTVLCVLGRSESVRVNERVCDAVSVFVEKCGILLSGSEWVRESERERESQSMCMCYLAVYSLPGLTSSRALIRPTFVGLTRKSVC